MPDDCFEKVDVILEFIDNDSFKITIRPLGDPKTEGCSDTYTVATYAEVHKPITVTKETSFTVMKASANKLKAINLYGLHVFRTCDQYANVLPDLFMTLALFIGGLGSNPDIPFFGSHPTW